MRAATFAAAVLVLLSSCAEMRRQIHEGYQVESSPNALNSPAEVAAYLKNHVPAKTLKDWDRHVSDDTVTVEVLSQ